jgi:hypothetical protein
LWGGGAPSACGPGTEARWRSRAGRCAGGDAGKNKGKKEMGAPTGGAAASKRESDAGCWAAGKRGATGRAEQAAGKGKGNGSRGKEREMGHGERSRPEGGERGAGRTAGPAGAGFRFSIF